MLNLENVSELSLAINHAIVESNHYKVYSVRKRNLISQPVAALKEREFLEPFLRKRNLHRREVRVLFTGLSFYFLEVSFEAL